jgi:hypothetical protein
LLSIGYMLRQEKAELQTAECCAAMEVCERLFAPHRIGNIVGSYQIECQPASIGEFWYDEFVRGILNGTNALDGTNADAYRHIKVS